MHLEPEQEESNEGMWAITYGDLMSYLMIFFLFLYAFAIQSQSSSVAKEQAQETLSEIQKAFGGEETQVVKKRREENESLEALKDTFVSSDTTRAVEIDSDERFLKLTLKDKIMFQPCEAMLNDDAKKVLHGFAIVAKEMPNDIIVEGHTDNMPPGRKCPFASNWILSMARAYSIIKYLGDDEGIDPSRMSGVGYGEYRPLVPNDSAENMSRNRRIQINIVRQQVF
ncbi:MAG: flagellar motor protein MotB [Elusimicrobiaceae bacterium]|nr:flagellar motor protein MotB [Candidatus Izemoplasmatales bacterium]MDD4005293.1 flagellar motor protein MotB [Elusimicrobiaceae bacterium]